MDSNQEASSHPHAKGRIRTLAQTRGFWASQDLRSSCFPRCCFLFQYLVVGCEISVSLLTQGSSFCQLNRSTSLMRCSFLRAFRTSRLLPGRQVASEALPVLALEHYRVHLNAWIVLMALAVCSSRQFSAANSLWICWHMNTCSVCMVPEVGKFVHGELRVLLIAKMEPWVGVHWWNYQFSEKFSNLSLRGNLKC